MHYRCLFSLRQPPTLLVNCSLKYNLLHLFDCCTFPVFLVAFCSSPHSFCGSEIFVPMTPHKNNFEKKYFTKTLSFKFKFIIIKISSYHHIPKERLSTLLLHKSQLNVKLEIQVHSDISQGVNSSIKRSLPHLLQRHYSGASN